jgi:hypothetical protein
MLATAAQHRALVPAYLLLVQTALIPVLFTSMPRFRAPIEPIVLLLAAVAVMRLAPQRWRGQVVA